MAYLVRKVSRGKWPDEKQAKDDYAGDTISDLRTTKNTLSLWMIESEEELDSAILALSASSKSETIEAIDVAWFPIEVIDTYGITISKDTLGDTVVSDLAETHRDVVNVTYKTLGDIADIITVAMSEQNRHKKVTLGTVKKGLAKAYKDKRISEEKCKPELLEKIVAAYNTYKDSI